MQNHALDAMGVKLDEALQKKTVTLQMLFKLNNYRIPDNLVNQIMIINSANISFFALQF